MSDTEHCPKILVQGQGRWQCSSQPQGPEKSRGTLTAGEVARGWRAGGAWCLLG